MPGATAGLGLPYPLATEPVSQGDDAIKALAERVETALKKLAVRHVPGSNNDFSNPTANTVFPVAADRTALTGTLTKQTAASALDLEVDLKWSLQSGAVQTVVWGLRINGVDYDISVQGTNAAVQYDTASGFRRVTGIAAGALTIEPYVRSQSAAAIQVGPYCSVCYKVEEVPA